MPYCIRCDKTVKKLTKTTGTCPICAKEEIEMGHYFTDQESEPKLAGKLANLTTCVEKGLEQEGYELDSIKEE